MPGRISIWSLLLACGFALVSAYALHRIQAHNDSYRAYDLTLPDGTPARLVLPGPPGPSFRIELPEGTPRPPLIVLTHGIIADKEMMSGLAHALARHGVAVLTLDWLGHGANANPFRPLSLQDQLAFVLAYARDELADVIDPERIGLMGHSMGAGATLEYGATHPAALDLTVAISGNWLRNASTAVPPNLLMIYASGDLPGIVEGVPETMRVLTEVEQPRLDETYGRFEDGSARRMVEVPRTDHVSILFSPVAVEAIVRWVGEVWPLGEQRYFHDPRLPWLGVVCVAALSLTAVLPWVLRPWLPVLDVQPYDKAVVRLAAIVAALALAVLLLPVGHPAGFIPMFGGTYLIAFFGVAGLMLLGFTAATGAADWQLFWPDWRKTLGAGFLFALAFYVLFGGASDGVWLHMTLAPHRVTLWAWSVVPLTLFAVAQDALTKKGPVWQALAMSWAATLAMVGVLAIGLDQGLTPHQVILVLPITAILALALEVPSASMYACTRNYFVTGMYRGAVLAAVSAACWPTIA